MFEAHYDIVFRLLRRMGLDPARAEDGAQQVFLVAAKRLPDVTDGKERAFLTGTAVNVAYRIPRGTLSTEARLLRIEALVAAGQKEEARKVAGPLLERRPGDMTGDRARKLLER